MFNKINTDGNLPHYAFPSIGQYAELISSVNRRCNYVGNDENGGPIYDKSLSKPKLKFIGTTKLHGTNAGVIIDFYNETVYYESRENVIFNGKDNAGFAAYMSTIQEEFVNMIINNLRLNETDFSNKSMWEDNILAIYGEWCGGSIQKGVALNQLEKMFVIFNATIRTREKVESKTLDWFPVEEINKLKITDKKVHNIYDFKTWEIEIDFDKHHESTNSIIDITLQVEDECPFAKAFGKEGIGEGIVFICVTKPYNTSEFWFKSKGMKHAKSKVTTITPVDSDKINRLIAIADKITPAWRLEQMFNTTFDILNGGVVERSKIGNYLKAVANDVIKEEQLTLVEEKVEYKELAKYVGKIATDYFFMMEKETLTNPQ